jgi:hypothetical protein
MEPKEIQKLEQLLEAAIVVSWADLMHGSEAGLIHVEYGFAQGGTVDYLKVWSSLTRGHWLLAGEYWMSASEYHDAGAHLEDGYQSEGLSNTLEFLMQNQDAFVLPKDLDRKGLLQISTPTDDESKAASTFLSDAYRKFGSSFIGPSAA